MGAEMEKFYNAYVLKLNKGDIRNISRLVANNEIEVVIKCLPGQTVMWTDFKIWHSTKLENLKDIDEFLDACSLLKIKQDEAKKRNRSLTTSEREAVSRNPLIINNLNRSITSSETEAVTRDSLTDKSPGPGEFHVEFYQIYNELTPIPCKLLCKTEKDGFWTLFYKSQDYNKSKPDKDTTALTTPSRIIYQSPW